MPSRNSVNKPKDKTLKRSHAASIGKRRASRAKPTTRSSQGRYNENSDPRPTDSKSVALYTGKVNEATTLTTKTLSNKKAKKLARNQKYIEKRLQKDLDGMQVDQENSLVKIKAKKESQSDKIREALSGSLNDLLKFKAVAGAEPTVVGIASF